MVILFLWVFFAAIVGFIATDKAMGFWGGFLLSLLLSPLIGFIIVVVSKSKQTHIMEQRVINSLPMQNQIHHHSSIADEIAKLKKQMDDGVITQDEFQILKAKLIS
jgi:hypothetical protein